MSLVFLVFFMFFCLINFVIIKWNVLNHSQLIFNTTHTYANDINYLNKNFARKKPVLYSFTLCC